MREIKYVEMADKDNIFEIGLGKRITMREDPEDPGFYQIMIEDEAVEDNLTKKEARKEMIHWAINSNLEINGYGRHSGRKFWQLPEKLKSRIKGIARRAV